MYKREEVIREETIRAIVPSALIRWTSALARRIVELDREQPLRERRRLPFPRLGQSRTQSGNNDN